MAMCPGEWYYAGCWRMVTVRVTLEGVARAEAAKSKVTN